MENINSVAYIAKIDKIEAIQGADKIQKATIKGWSSVVQSSVHNEGDLVLCIVTDAVISEELALKWGVKEYLRKGNRVRTVKLKGVLSECILIPTNDIGVTLNGYFEGKDMMSFTNITKYEPPINNKGQGMLSKPGRRSKQANNNFHIYHKFPNAKNVPNMFNETDTVEVTRKIHGTNARYGICRKDKLGIIGWFKKLFGNKWIQYEFVYGSHNVQKEGNDKGYYADNYWNDIAVQYRIKDQMWKFVKSTYKPEHIGKGITIYGEIYGAGVQGDKYNYGLTNRKFAGFDIKFDENYMNSIHKFNIFTALGLDTVELLYTGPFKSEFLTKWNNDKMENGYYHEGVVISSITGDRNRIMKVISPNYTMGAEKFDIPDSH